ncbi:MAG: choice-of-anchor D domain-containing protein [Dysgonamonadaceae bacterium]|jgi:hypothetical protein|nr:choice-of-anchor D domain-containing protein [Dysgonamonadaceae bacterium]
MKRICSVLTVCLLAILSWGTARAAEKPTISPADGSNDVWYHIQLESRKGSDITTDKAFYYDQGKGELLKNINSGINEPGTRWKFVETGTTDRYQLISGLGNTLDHSTKNAFDVVDRYFTTTPGAQVFEIQTTDEGNFRLYMVGVGGVDKSNTNPYFDIYTSGAGVQISFIPAEPLTEMFLFQPDDLDLGVVPAGKTKTKTLTVAGLNLNADLEYSITPEGIFSVKHGQTTSSGGTAEITFAPVEKKAYTAELTISIGEFSVTASLTGNADFDFPLQISDETDHWYYIQVARQAVNNKVLQAGEAEGDAVRQALIAGNEDKQLWKIVGDWDGYHIENKAGFELSYDVDINRYVVAEIFYGHDFGFERFEDTEDWQLRNMTDGYAEGDGPSDLKRYLNDLDADGDSLTNYVQNDEGCRLIFIPSTNKALVVGMESADFGSVPYGQEASIKKTIPAGGLNLTGDITATIIGQNTDAYALTATTVNANGGEFEVTFTPLGIDTYKAQLVLSAQGVPNDTVQLTARGSAFPFTVSKDNDEHWYYIQFARKPALALTAKGLNEEISQEGWLPTDARDDNKLWKIIGTWDNYKFVSKTGGELASLPTVGENGDNEYSNYKLVAAGSGDRHIAEERTDPSYPGWGFLNVEAKEAGDTKYMNDYGGLSVCLYGYLDTGGSFNFISAAETVISLSATTLNFGDVTTGLRSEKILTVTGTATTAPITYTLGGSGSAAFTVINTTAGGTDGSLPEAGGSLKILFDPAAEREYTATLTLESTGAEKVIVILDAKCVPFPEDFPVKVSDDNSETWYTVYFKRRYDSTNSYKVWTAGIIGEAITQTPHTGRENSELTAEEQLWKFVVAPSKNGYLAISNSGLEAKTGGAGVGTADYTLVDAGEGTVLVFAYISENWVLKNTDTGGSHLNDRSGSTICEYGAAGTDGGNPLGFIETALPAPVRIQISTDEISLEKIEVGAPAIYSSNVIVKGVRFTGDISLALTGDGASAYKILRAADSTEVVSIPAEGDTLKITFAPAERKTYNATINLTAAGAEAKTIALTGAGLKLPAKPSNATEEIWYYISFERQVPPAKTVTKVFTADSDTLRQLEKATEELATQLWKLEGTAEEGYRIINKESGLKLFYDSLSAVKTYLLLDEGDRFNFISGSGDNAAKVQMYNRTNAAGGSYLNDKAGNYATNYSKSDGGNWLIFTPLIFIPDAIATVDAENDPVTSSAYYNLQGIRTQQLDRNNFYIRINTHESGKTTATKIFPVK